jgi:hypothetical protein
MFVSILRIYTNPLPWIAYSGAYVCQFLKSLYQVPSFLLFFPQDGFLVPKNLRVYSWNFLRSSYDQN